MFCRKLMSKEEFKLRVMRESLEGDVEDNIVTALSRLMHEHKELDMEIIKRFPASTLTIYLKELNKESEEMKSEEKRRGGKTFGS